jgi:N-acyl homoserine lactone hydrolase
VVAATRPKLALLPVGACFVDQSQLVSGRPKGIWWRAPIHAFLVRADQSLFLFDTGMPRRLIERPWALFDPEGRHGDEIYPVMRPRDAVVARLAEAGLTPTDLDGAITSHWHFDHAGGLADLAGRPILVQRAEVEAAAAATGNDGDRAFWLEGEHRLERIDGDRELAPGVTLLATPGHTPGHQSLLVTTATGAYLLTSDAVYTRVNWDEERPGAMVDPELGRRSVARLKAVARDTAATVIFSHDPVQARDLLPHPHWYG